MKKLVLIVIVLILAIVTVGQPSTLIEHPYVVKHMSNKDQIFTATVGKYFVGYSPISQGDSVLYYSTSGTPAGFGTYSSPLPIDSINTLRSNGKKVLARIKRGDVYNGTITLVDNNIIVCSYSTINTTAKPVISGFTTITGWTNEGGGIYSKTITVESNPEIVTVNGVQYAMGRTPNSDRYNPEYDDYYHIDSYSGTTQITDSECNASVTNWTGAEIIIRSNNFWDWTRTPITGHSGTTLTITNSAADPIGNGFGYFIQDDLRTLDQFGEWYYGSGKLYMYFGAANPVDYTVKVTTKNQLAFVDGYDNITFRNLKFEGANSIAVATKSSSSNAYNLTVDNCDFDFNYTAIYGHQAPNMTVTNCNILRSSDRGIYNHWNSDGAYIANNVIDSTSLVLGAFNGQISAGSGTAIMHTYAKLLLGRGKSIIENNRISNTGYNAIYFSGDSSLVRNNYIYNFTQNRTDGGGIYHGNQAEHLRMVVDKNISINGKTHTDISGIPLGTTNTSSYCIYFDYYSTNFKIKNNVVANAPGGIYLHGSQIMEVESNLIYNCGTGVKTQELNGMTNPTRFLTFQGNKIISDSEATSSLVSFRSLSEDFDEFGYFDYNYYSNKIDDNSQFITMANTWTPTYHNFPSWKTYTTHDSHSYLTYNKGSGTIFDYNETATPKTVSLTGNYKTVDSVQYNTSYTLQPFTGIVLIKDTITTVTIDSIYAIYPLNQNLNDTIGTQHGTNSGTVYRAGKFKTAVDFDNNTDFAYFPINTSTLTNKSYSVAFWVKFDALPSTVGVPARVISDVLSGPSFKLDIYVSTSNAVVATIRNAALSNFTTTGASGAISQTDVWYRIIVNIPKVGQGGIVYVNGSKSGNTGTTVTGTDRESNYRFYLGPYTGSVFAGDMTVDDLLIRNKWFSAIEAEFDYNDGDGRAYP